MKERDFRNFGCFPPTQLGNNVRGMIEAACGRKRGDIMSVTMDKPTDRAKQTILIEGATVRLAGDSGDGMQLAGTQLTGTSAKLGNDVATFPDFPAEIRAPAVRWQGSAGSRFISPRRTSSHPATS